MRLRVAMRPSVVPFIRLSVVALGGLASFAACSSETSSAPVGVNDVRKACELRSAWVRPPVSRCTDCVSLSKLERCECASHDYEGKCHELQKAKSSEASCSDVDGCVIACDATDCGCVDACYAGKDACRTRAASLDGCVTEVCESACR